MFAILTFIITTCYLFQSWGIEYSHQAGITITLIACIPAAVADYKVIKEILQKA